MLCNNVNKATIYLATFTSEQTVMVPRDFITTDWTQLFQTCIMSILHSVKQKKATMD